ncbi:MAG: heme exporter protein CcmD [Gammaproteobacteria bacterium]|nr:heme exporter protein CcmD [Gammaproteobacteria bacterium]
MQFNSLSDFIAMGDYGAYVWSSVAIVFGALAWIVVDSVMLKSKTLKAIKQEQERAEKIRQAKQQNSV